MEQRLRETTPALVAVALGLTLAGCENKVNHENYDKLAIGMDYSKVIELLGEPRNCQSIVAVKTCTWGNEPKTISAQFMGEKVMFYSNSGL